MADVDRKVVAYLSYRLRVVQSSARGSVELFFSSCTKCPAMTRSTDLVYAPVPRRRNESTDLASAYGVPAYGNSFRTKKIVSPRPPSVSIGFWIILLLTVGLGSVRADLLDSSIKERISNPADLEKSNHRCIKPSRGDST